MYIGKYKFIAVFIICIVVLFGSFQLAKVGDCIRYAQKNDKEYEYSLYSGLCLIKHPDGPWFTRNTYESLIAVRVER